MPKNMRSKNMRKNKKGSKKRRNPSVGKMRNGTRGHLQLSVSNTSTNRNYAGTQTYIKMSKDNLRSLQLLAGRLDKADLNDLGVSSTQQPGLKKHFVTNCKTISKCFNKNNLNEFPELKGNTVVAGTGSNPKGQANFCELLEKVVKALYTENKSFARERILRTLRSLRKSFSSMSSNKSVKSSVRKSSNRIARSPLSSPDYSSATLEENAISVSLTGDCNYEDTLSELQTILDGCGDKSTRNALVNDLQV